jgi:hypothetical protein
LVQPQALSVTDVPLSRGIRQLADVQAFHVAAFVKRVQAKFT